MSTASLLWSVVFGSVGIGYFIYGKRQMAVVPLACGVALIVFPYFVSSTVWLVVIGLALAALPFVYRP